GLRAGRRTGPRRARLHPGALHPDARDDLLLSTLRQYLAAAGAVHAKIVVEKEGVEITLDLDSFG
ncbi:hypothetical protein, partial [Streptomyces vietnamensis]|uniref:hypothetical protein n=1 Tax=Streptomyces vietnamensis TaxID=362257 RepID=UPI003498EAA5